MKTNQNCCADTYCETVIAELPRYYPRQLITPDDLTLEQDYFRDRMRRHNRLMHGFGVVCGAVVCPLTTKAADATISLVPWQVKVGKGYILGPYGDEIIVDCERTIDLRTSGVSGVTGETCIDAPDPWCTPVFVAPTEALTLHIAIKYKQCMTRPVRVQPIGCGCDDTACEYSRWRDGYEIGVLQECPPCNTGPAPFDPCTDPHLVLPKVCTLPECPDCSCGPWVGLATVTLDPDGTVTSIDNCTCRRLAVSLSQLWWICGASLTHVDVNNKPVHVKAGEAAPVQVTVRGTNLSTKAIYSFGDGVIVRNPTATPNLPEGTSIDLEVLALSRAPATSRPLKIVNYPDCSWGAVPDAITIDPAVAGHQIIAGGLNAAVVSNTPAAVARQPRKASKARPARRKKT